MNDNYPYNIEAAQALVIEWSPDIEWDFEEGYPNVDESVFEWSRTFRGIGLDINFYHVWMRYKIGKKGSWVGPIKMKGNDGSIGGLTLQETSALIEQMFNNISADEPIFFTDNVISHKLTEGFKHVPAGGTIGQLLSTNGISNYSWVDGTPEYTADGVSSRFSEVVNVTTIKEALDQIFKFISIDPVISISSTTSTALRERGDDITNPVINGSAVLGANPSGTLTSMEFFRGTVAGTPIGSQASPTPSTLYPKTDIYVVSNNQTYTVRITDSEGRTDTAALTFTFTYPFYVGYVDEQTDIVEGISKATILGLGGMSLLLKSTATTTPVTSTLTNARYCIMYPATLGNLTSILDNSGFETISSYDVFTYNVVGLDLTPVSYKVYILNADTTQTSFTNQFIF